MDVHENLPDKSRIFDGHPKLNFIPRAEQVAPICTIWLVVTENKHILVNYEISFRATKLGAHIQTLDLGSFTRHPLTGCRVAYNLIQIDKILTTVKRTDIVLAIPTGRIVNCENTIKFAAHC